MMTSNKQTTFGVIFGNRDFFPDQLVAEARSEMKQVLCEHDCRMICLSDTVARLGGVESYVDAQACAGLFRANREIIDGVIVCLPNFGDEKGVADVIRLAGLDVPILIQAYPDSLDKLSPALRRDAFCGKISVCNNLRQRGIPYSLTREHVVSPVSKSFSSDLKRFTGICRVVNKLRHIRIGAVGARPGAFNTVRYSEKILERSGISVTTVDLSEILGRAERLDSESKQVKAVVDQIKSYAPTTGVPEGKLVQMARLDAVLREWVAENNLDATAIQCWTSLQQSWGCNVCTSMSMMSEQLLPSACEVDVTGALTMAAMQWASNSPSALVDWNNNYGKESDQCVLFHCGNWAKHFQPHGVVSNAPILGSTLGVENTYGAMDGRTPANLLTYGRLTTDDTSGTIRAYVGEGELTDQELKTFGNRAVARVPDLNQLMHYICNEGFEHHVVMNLSHTADILAEAFENYLKWPTYYHARQKDN